VAAGSFFSTSSWPEWDYERGRGGDGEAHWDRLRDDFNMNGSLRFASKKFGNQEQLKTPTSSAPSRD
jgi:hypothetical protein